MCKHTKPLLIMYRLWLGLDGLIFLFLTFNKRISMVPFRQVAMHDQH